AEVGNTLYLTRPSNCANENRRCVLSNPSCSFNLPNEMSTIGSFFQSPVSRNADKTQSVGRHVLPVLSVYNDLPLMRISVSFANVSAGLRRPPSCIASKPNCLKSRPPLFAAGGSDCP